MSQQSVEKMYDLIEDLNKLFEDGVHVIPSCRMLVRTKEFERILEAFPDAISNEIRDAHVILRKKEEILQNAKIKADRIISDAENEKMRILSESSLIKDMEEKADKFRQDVMEECENIKMKAFNEAEGVRLEATQEAIKIRENVNNFASQVLSKLEEDLNQLYQAVLNNQQYLTEIKNGELQQNITDQK